MDESHRSTLYLKVKKDNVDGRPSTTMGRRKKCLNKSKNKRMIKANLKELPAGQRVIMTQRQRFRSKTEFLNQTSTNRIVILCSI